MSSALAVPKVIVPGPDTFDQRYEAMPEVTSVVEAFCVNKLFFILSVPASTIGAVLST